MNEARFVINSHKHGDDAKCFKLQVKYSSPYNRPRRSRWGVEAQLYSFFNLDVRWRWVFNATPRPHYPRERPGTHCIKDWVGPRPVWTDAEIHSGQIQHMKLKTVTEGTRYLQHSEFEEHKHGTRHIYCVPYVVGTSHTGEDGKPTFTGTQLM